MKPHLKPFLLFTLLLISGQGRTRAADIDVSSLTPPFNFSGFLTTNTWYANAFQTLNYPGLGLVDQVYLRLAAADLAKAPNLLVRFYNDNAGQVGNSLLESFVIQSQPVLKNGVMTALYKPSNSGLLLAPNTKYWLVVGGTSNLAGNAAWLGRNTNSEIIGLNAKILPESQIGYNMMPSGNGGQSWQGCWVPNSNCKMFEFAITAPEPSTYVFGTIVSAFLALTARNPRLRALHRRNPAEISPESPLELPLSADPASQTA